MQSANEIGFGIWETVLVYNNDKGPARRKTRLEVRIFSYKNKG